MVSKTLISRSILEEVELIDVLADGTPQTFNATQHDSRQLTGTLFGNLKLELESVLPWFEEQMPPFYHEVTPASIKQQHLVDIVSGHVVSNQEIAERVNGRQLIRTIVAPGDNGAACVTLANHVGRLKAKFGSIILSLDNKIAICSLHQANYSTQNSWSTTKESTKREIVLKKLAEFPQVLVEQYLASLDAEYVQIATPRMIASGFEAFSYLQTHENSYVKLFTIENDQSEKRVRIDIGLKRVAVPAAIKNVAAVFSKYNISVRRIIAHELVTQDNQQIAFLQIVAAPQGVQRISPELREWNRVLKGLKTLSYVDHDDEFSVLLEGKNPLSLNETNLIRAAANWTHIFLTKANPYYYTIDRVAKTLLKNEQFMLAGIGFFRSKFDVKFEGDRNKISSEFLQKMEAFIAETSDEVEKSILKECGNFLRHILKTNYFLVSKGALSFRVDPRALNPQHYSEQPYGIFYMIGRDFRAFQVRYRDIARGGVRVVMPRSMADYDHSLAGLFDEVNGLAYAQQLKNKDIPEGGSKCVFVLRPGGDRHLAVKSGISGLLDLITLDPTTGRLDEKIIDYWGQEEIIYLGPDENMTDDLIVWTIQHALHRGYKYAYAFMSSKPDFGINHKTYGVTSEGVNVYLDNVLRYLNLNKPGQSFRVKMTGGPDGDVAGNELKILHREYGERAKVVAIGDGFGAAFDPNGLHWPELLRLVHESKSIVEFNRDILSKDPRAFVIRADSKENMKTRDSLYATVEAEIFIPAGGRPYTVKESNWNKYLNAEGKPSSLAIVEGANIFFTPEARKKLVEAGVIVIKDSSANKAGVICSSYEIIACLTLSPQEFAEMKTIYVKQVVDILKQKADQEAKLLFNEWRKRKHETNLVDLSYEISLEINRATDIARDYLNKLTDQELASDKYMSILHLHCPAILVERYKERLMSRLPRAHKIAIISAFMASHLIYLEGLNWLDAMEPEQVFLTALNYVHAENLVEAMVSEVAAAQVTHREQIISILRGAGAKHLASSIR